MEELVAYIRDNTNLSESVIEEIIDCYQMCDEIDDVNNSNKYYHESISLISGYKTDTVEKVMDHLTQYVGMLM